MTCVADCAFGKYSGLRNLIGAERGLPVLLWDGSRQRTPRTVLSQQTVLASGLSFSFVSERIVAPTDWCFSEPHHVLVIHHDGNLDSMESAFTGGPADRVLPRVGDVWVIPAEYRYAALAKGRTVGFCEIAVPTTIFGDDGPSPQIGSRDPMLHRLTERLRELTARADSTASLLGDSIAETVRLHIRDRYGPAPQRPGTDTRTALDEADRRLLVEFVDANLHEHVRLGQLAALVDMPVATFMRAFRDAFGVTPHQFLIDRRMWRAKVMLTTSRMAVTEIAMAVGYCTPSHFATTFKQRVGVTPSDYRAADL